MKRPDGYKQTGLITPLENERILQLYNELSGKLFRARELHHIFNLSPVVIQRYLWIGRDLGLFGLHTPSVGNKSAVYKTMNVDAADILSKVTRQTHKRQEMVTLQVDTDCMLANILGLRPIEHDCSPRFIPEKKVLRATRGREKVYVAGSWMVGL